MSGTGDTCRVLGVDPGLSITGYGVVDVGWHRSTIVEAGAIRTDTGGSMSRRIVQIHEAIAEIIAELRPQRVAIEKLYAHYKHPRTSILMAHARGVIMLAAAQAGLPVQDLPATRVKKSITGNGHASKHQVQLAIQGLCGLAEVPEPPDVADAIAIALCAGKAVTLPG